MKINQNNFVYVGVLVLLFVMGCKFAQFGGNTGLTTANQLSDPKDVIAGALRNLQTAESWAAEVETLTDAAPQADTKMEIEYAAPDLFHLENNSGGSQFEVIMIGADNYLLNNGKWQKAPAGMNMSQMVNNWKQMYNPENTKAFKDVQFVGEETANGKQTLVYSYRIEPLAGMSDEAKSQMTEAAKTQIADMNNTAKIWIDHEKRLPVKIEMTTRMTKPKEMTSKLNFDYKFDGKVKIEAPALAANSR